MKLPGLKPSRPAFGAGWALAFVPCVVAGALLWTGIAGDGLARAHTLWGPMVGMAWLGALATFFLVVPLLLPRGASSGRFRAFQIAALGLAVLALIGAIALRSSALLDTVREGVRIALLLELPAQT